jgi:hypothetical protein
MNFDSLIQQAKGLIQGRLGGGGASASPALAGGDTAPLGWFRGFLADGFSGWIFPTACSVIMSIAWWRDAVLGDPAAHAFLKDNGNTCVAWMGAIMVPWLGYKGWAQHVRARVVTAQVQAASATQTPAASDAGTPSS